MTKLLKQKEIAAWEKDKREVTNYVKVLEYVDRLGEEGVKHISEELSKGIDREQVYRNNCRYAHTKRIKE